MVDLHGIMDKRSLSFKIYEFPNSYVITTFKIGTRVFEQTRTRLNTFDYLQSFYSEDDVFELLKDKSKDVYFLIKNPINRFVTGAVQVTFQGACIDTSFYSLAKWGSETFYFTDFLSEFSNEFPIYADKYEPSFSMKEFDSILDKWKTWVEIVNFNQKIGNPHLSNYHEEAYNGLYKDIRDRYNVIVIKETEMKKEEVFRKVTYSKLPEENHSNSIWNTYIKTHIINTVDYNQSRVRLHPGLASTITHEVEKYLSKEILYYQEFQKLIK